MKKELSTRLAAEIEKSGVPVEIRAASELRRQEWLAIPNLHFQDLNGKAHEMDVYGSLILPEDDHWPHFPPGIEMVIECKKSAEKPWVFFEDNVEIVFVKDVFQKLRTLCDLPAMNHWSLGVSSAGDFTAAHHYADARIPIARAHFEAFRSHNSESTIFSAFRSVWYGQDCLRRWFQSQSQSGDARNRAKLLHGVVVLDGELVLAKPGRGRKWRTIAVNHIMVRTIDALTVATKSPLSEENEVIIDVIRSSYLKKYLEICAADLRGYATHLRARDAAGHFLKVGAT